MKIIFIVGIWSILIMTFFVAFLNIMVSANFIPEKLFGIIFYFVSSLITSAYLGYAILPKSYKKVLFD